MGDIDVRPVSGDAELGAMIDLDALAFHHVPPPGRRVHDAAWIRPAETLCAFDDGRVVGASLAHRTTLSVPGGSLPCGAVTWVGVAPTHRRRGVLRRMMSGHLDALRADGVPVAALWASEAGIYGRFGYGVATQGVSHAIALGDRTSGPRRPATPGVVRMLDPAAARDVLGPIYDRVAARRAGVLGRDASWWDHHVLADPADDRDGEGPLRLVVAGPGPDAYALYRTRAAGPDREDDTAIRVVESVAADDDAGRELWSHLLSIDLVATVLVRDRPPDDPLPELLRDPRTDRRTLGDALWLRLVDLPGAIAGRAWAPADLVVEVADDVLAGNAGRWRLALGADGGRCTPTTAPADLALPADELAAAYLGGGSLVRAVAAGRVAEHAPGAAEVLDLAARTARAPWNVSVF